MRQRLFGRPLGLQARITLGVAAATSVILAVFTFIAIRAVQESTATVMAHRLQVATAFSDRIAGALNSHRHELEDLAWALSREPGPRGRIAAMEETRWNRRFSALAVIGPDGGVAWSRPAGWPASMTPTVVSARPAPSARGVLRPEGGLTALTVPVQGGGVLVGAVDLERVALADVGAGAAGVTPIDFEVMDPSGVVRASGDLSAVGRVSEHLPVLTRFIARGRPAIAFHDVPHRPHYVVYTPLTGYPGWAVNVEEARDVVLSLPLALRTSLIALGAVIIVGMSALALLDTRGVLRPLVRLREAAEHIAAGNLDVPVRVERRDEVGTLAQAFEAMRVNLRASREEIAAWNRELEDRVANRTQELTAAHALRRRLLERLVNAQEDERHRIARELHDEIGQALTALVLQLGTVETALPPEAASLRSRLAAVRAQTSDAVANVRRLMLDLRPAVLDDLGLVPAIRWYAGSHLPAAGVDARVSVSGLEGHQRIPKRLELVTFRLIQEAITNVIRHAHAGHVVITLARDGPTLDVSIEDDGCGFDTETPPRPNGHGGWGLVGMRERVALLGGTLRVASRPHHGTRVSATMPVEEIPRAD